MNSAVGRLHSDPESSRQKDAGRQRFAMRRVARNSKTVPLVEEMRAPLVGRPDSRDREAEEQDEVGD